jgi:hypothetical protein
VTTVVGTVNGTFVVKTGTRGHPARYSRIRVEKGGVTAELHMNLLMRGAHDEGVYCVDVGVVQPGVVPEKAGNKQKWVCVENEFLITFGEVKRLVVYPMLLAQFVGIVHEIKPDFLADPAPERFDRYRHLPPVLMALGHFSGNSAAIVRAYERRSIRLCIAENFDMRIAAHRKQTCASPLFWDVEVETAAAGPAVTAPTG